MIRNYRDLTRWEMEQIDKEETIVLIPLGALEQHGSQAPLGTDDIIAEAMISSVPSGAWLPCCSSAPSGIRTIVSSLSICSISHLVRSL